MKIYPATEYPQLSPAWWSLRCGVPTASEFHRIITARDAKPSKSAQAYAAELAADLQCQSPQYFTQKGRPVNRHQEYGRDTEGEAVEYYAFHEGVEVERVGFITTDDGRFGCSPDFLIRKDGAWVGGGEVKCPEPKKHADLMLRGELPLEYKAQVHGCLAVTGLPYWAFVQYSPPLPAFILKIEPDAYTQALRDQLEAFHVLYQEVKAKLGIKPPSEECVAADKVWREYLERHGRTLDRFNRDIREIAELSPDAKRVAWRLIVEHAHRQGWIFDRDARTFRVKVDAGL